ncbi:MAG: sigma-70 family RNA polymerase sigma factor [Myxococcales bacterium]|nr:sigma-70 family RNA polymerase sigma factor [Myxococcales bacterium]
MVELLEHAEWVRGLATRLAREDADDAAQDVWLAALRSPPDSSRPPRPWLARVLQNAARKRFRDESTRRAYETAAPEADAETSPEALVGRVQVQHLLVELVLGLDEPFRQTLLLRFFEGKSSAEIAEASGVPAGTVRWRLKEGLERVRTALDARHHGDRKAWLLTCAPLLLPPAGPWLTAGVALMEKKVRVAIVVVIVLLVGLLAGWSFSERPGADARATTPPVERVAAPSSSVPVATAVPSVVRVEPAIAAPSASPLPSTLAAPVVDASPVAPVSHLSAPAITAPSTPSGGIDGGVRYPLDKEGIRAAVKSAIPDVKDCYESWLAMNPALGGRLIVKLTIDTDDGVEGRVTRLSLADGGMGNVAFEGCALSSFSDLRFEPPLDGPMNVTYPLVFSSADAGH